MKTIIMVGALLASTAAFADNQNWYCGNGRDNFVVEDADISLVISDGKAQIWDKDDLKQKAKLDKVYKVKKVNGGYLADVPNKSPNSGYATMLFSICDAGKATLKLGGNMAPTATLLCTCEEE